MPGTELDPQGLLDQKAVLAGPELAERRRGLAAVVAAGAASPNVAAIYLYGSAARGEADGYSDLDLTFEARPGGWAALWDERASLAAAAGEVAVDYDGGGGETKDHAGYTAIVADGLCLDLVIRRNGAARPEGEVLLWGAASTPTATPAGAAEPAPTIATDTFAGRMARFWCEALRCAQSLARGDLWTGHARLDHARDLFLQLWRAAHGPQPEQAGARRLRQGLPDDVHRRLAATVTRLDRNQLAVALWAAIDLMVDVGPDLARLASQKCPGDGPQLVRAMIKELSEVAGLPVGASDLIRDPEVGTESPVSLREITHESAPQVCRLDVDPFQHHVAAPNAVSLAQACFVPVKAWPRAIYAGDTLVGFIMLWDNPEKSEYFIWRLMIDQRYQGLGFGRKAVELVVDYARGRPGAVQLGVSYGIATGGPRAFYQRLGFVETGERLADEHVAKLDL